MDAKYMEKIAWDHCNRLNKFLKKNEQRVTKLKTKSAAQVVYQDPAQTPIIDDDAMYEMNNTWKYKMDIPGGMDRDSFGHGYYSEFFLSVYLGNYVDFYKIISRMSKKELEEQLQRREGYFSISPVSAAILGSINLHEEFSGISPIPGLKVSGELPRMMAKLFPKRKMEQDKIWKKLIEVGAPVNCHDLMGATPLHYLVKNLATCPHMMDLAKALIKNGADVNAVDRFGMSSLAYAVYWDSLSYVKFLIRHGADPFLQYSNDADRDITILQFASTPENLSAEMVLDLLEASTDSERKIACEVCGEMTKMKCSACKAVWYCSQNCLKTDRSVHKGTCNIIKEERWKQAGID